MRSPDFLHQGVDTSCNFTAEALCPRAQVTQDSHETTQRPRRQGTRGHCYEGEGDCSRSRLAGVVEYQLGTAVWLHIKCDKNRKGPSARPHAGSHLGVRMHDKGGVVAEDDFKEGNC